MAEKMRLLEDKERSKNWKRWGPYLSERQWGTVREDYSADGNWYAKYSFNQLSNIVLAFSVMLLRIFLKLIDGLLELHDITLFMEDIYFGSGHFGIDDILLKSLLLLDFCVSQNKHICCKA